MQTQCRLNHTYHKPSADWATGNNRQGNGNHEILLPWNHAKHTSSDSIFYFFLEIIPSIRLRISILILLLWSHAKYASSDFNFKSYCCGIMPSIRLRIWIFNIVASKSCQAYVFGLQLIMPSIRLRISIFKVCCFEIMTSILFWIVILDFVVLAAAVAADIKVD